MEINRAIFIPPHQLRKLLGPNDRKKLRNFLSDILEEPNDLIYQERYFFIPLFDLELS